MNESLQKILEIDLRHNELMDRLTDLDTKIQAVLEEWTKGIASDHQTVTTNQEAISRRP